MRRHLAKKVSFVVPVDVPVDAPVEIGGIFYKKGLRGFVYALYGDDWVRSAVSEDDLARRMMEVDRSLQGQGMAAKYAV